VAFGQTLPEPRMPVGAKMADMVQCVINGVDRQQIPSGQYQAVLIDEGHDFAPEWLKLVAQMVDPSTNSLLVLYDDAQSIYERSKTREVGKQFSFKSLDIQAQGRTTILKINYRNTRQILQTASLVAADLLTAEDKDEDSIPMPKPVSCGRDGEAPLIIPLPSLRAEATRVAEVLGSAHQEGHAWGDMATICRQAAPQSAMSLAPTSAPEFRAPAFQCDGRKTCRQMTSCSEAKLFLKNCPGMEMNGDGIPCEQQWCTGVFGG
jgi:hypothetical protein